MIILKFPGVSVIKKKKKNLLVNAGDAGLIPGSGRSLGGVNGNPAPCFCLEGPTSRGVWWAVDHVVTKCWTVLRHMHT